MLLFDQEGRKGPRHAKSEQKEKEMACWWSSCRLMSPLMSPGNDCQWVPLPGLWLPWPRCECRVKIHCGTLNQRGCYMPSPGIQLIRGEARGVQLTWIDHDQFAGPCRHIKLSNVVHSKWSLLPPMIGLVLGMDQPHSRLFRTRFFFSSVSF